MWTTAATRALPRGSISASRAAFGLRIVHSRRHKWTLTKTPSRTVAEHGLAILEDEQNTLHTPRDIVEIKHFLRTRELDKKTRNNFLKTKLTEFIAAPLDPQWADTYFHTVDSVLMQTIRETGQIDSILPMDEIFKLFDKTAQFFLDADRTDMPEYMALLAQRLLRVKHGVPTSTLVNIVEIGSRSRFADVSASLKYVLKVTKCHIGPEFMQAVMARQAAKGTLNLDFFEGILNAQTASKQHNLVNDDVVTAFIGHILHIFADTNPRVHEFMDENRNLYRVQYLANELTREYLKTANIECLLRLLKLKADLNSVRASDADTETVHTILMHLEAHGDHDNFAELKLVLFKQDIHDESLASTVLSQLALANSHDSFLKSLCEFVALDEIKFLPHLRLQALLLDTGIKSRGVENDVLFSKMNTIYTPFVVDSESEPGILTSVLQTVSASHVTDPQNLLDTVCNDIIEKTGVELTVADYKVMIDRALRNQEVDLAYSLFEESLTTTSVHWAESLDPAVASTLDNLVALVAQTGESAAEMFPRFKKIKQHMPMKCSAEALHRMCEKMLADACVGDVIELLKREFPPIKKDAYRKIRVDLPYAAPHKKLFHLLYRFVVTYKEDPTFETNWVLYGEIHKYFHIPYKTYLPVIETFCEVDRLNAAMLIVRRMKMLSELHADSNVNPPPLREIYTYLLRVFGDKLYEEGVVELHEYLKMDTNIVNQDIGMQNCILNAYSNLQKVGKARDLFLAISSNPKQHGGINEETAQIMLKTYTYSGLPYVQSFWNSLSQYGIFPDYAVFRQYVIAHTYHGNIEGAVKLVEEIDDYNLEFSSDLLLSMHNYCIEPEKQQEIADWAKENHKGMWAELQQSGLLKSATPYMPDENLIASGADA
ncbi:hypothetical protein HF325_002617 [Metschnikowia pulcherrima]|uniref:Mitochondrial group I intron splicing factor CCM1 n=1 Tax=Metschnikowia pulcherrima TaxID=27326 RepID=A0A8H7LFT9_9ASCO|nr:hypothetical protein HF325_002617 [Metschnikowia pulcherrima]